MFYNAKYEKFQKRIEINFWVNGMNEGVID